MAVSHALERRVLQSLITILALLPISAGAAGVLLGPGFLAAEAPWPSDLDSHLRFLSGIFLAMGLTYWTCVPGIENKGVRFRMLALFTFCGGLARLFSLGLAGWPSNGHVVGLVMELGVLPLLVLWQMRIARLERREPHDAPI